MTMAIPDSHKEENLKLTADAYVDLFHIQLRSGSNFYIKNGDPISWGGNDWESLPISLSGYEVSSDEQVSRPKLQIVNPDGVFSKVILDGEMDKAYIYRYRVLRRDLEADRPVYQMLMWLIWYPTLINKHYVEFELRNPMDGNNFYVPARQYLPPDFPTVTFK
jgi:lambda family phage minor tail protein L